jgi:hypothetical protein
LKAGFCSSSKGGDAMLPMFLIEEITVRESGESAIFDASEHYNQNLVLTLGITHAVEQESIGVDIYGSEDGRSWSSRPLVTLAPKSYCGTYQLTLRRCEVRYIKAVWRVLRWTGGDQRPFFRFYLFAAPSRALVKTAGAA